MVNYRRHKSGNPDDEYFFTIVTNGRHPRFSDKSDRDTIHVALSFIRGKYQLVYKAWTILPDHIHLLLKSPITDYSRVIWDLKRHLTFRFRRDGKIMKGVVLWQDRFWETTVRGDDHHKHCVDYIHYNPVKHGLVSAPVDWEHSSIHSYIKKGYLPPDWGDADSIYIEGAEYD